jgi:hypothetical protein
MVMPIDWVVAGGTCATSRNNLRGAAPEGRIRVMYPGWADVLHEFRHYCRRLPWRAMGRQP